MVPNSPITLKYATLSNNETYAYREAGISERTLFLLHGNFTTSLFFEPFMLKMSKSFRVIAPDMRGFGHSTYNTSIDSFEDICDDIKEFLESLHIKKISLLGWSLGGPVALLFASKYPTYIENLITVGSVGPKGTMLKDTEGVLMKTKEDFLACQAIQGSIKMIETKDETILKWFLVNAGFQGKEVPSEEKIKEYIEEIKLQRNVLDVFYALNSFNITDEFNGICEGTGQIEKIQGPCLFIHGNQDVNVKTTCSLELKEYVKQGEVKIIEGGRHFLFEAPYMEKVAKLVKDFIGKEECGKPEREEARK